ncbi:hypothetical protein A6R68_15443 [Neotoma lepida]|uniref:Uncharacterized protein n=1 Tax=Neotoma lepida TaxID=56216 RepID=A0A1A6H8U8_NEOLE|nr:hypothetical protein A6R68_15443 [Neotoma lepida]
MEVSVDIWPLPTTQLRSPKEQERHQHRHVILAFLILLLIPRNQNRLSCLGPSPLKMYVCSKFIPTHFLMKSSSQLLSRLSAVCSGVELTTDMDR